MTNVSMTITQRETNWNVTPMRRIETTISLSAGTEAELFSHYFREYANRFKYCNDLHFWINNADMAAKYRVWISDAKNYAASGGDMT